MTDRDRTVSFDDEPLILVDGDDRVIGHASKHDCHAGEGILHRAFSVFLFDAAGRTLLQQRSHAKRLWPGYWSNACCSHPRRGESVGAAVTRRLEEELGVVAPVSYLFKFEYQARFGDTGIEHELCYVYAGPFASPLAPNGNEIAAVRWIEPDVLDGELALRPERYTPWLKLEWERLRAQYRASLASLVS